MPTENALKKSLETTLVNANRRTHSDEKNQVDTCCRSLLKCDAYNRIAFNQTYNPLWNIRSCDCVHLFHTCLDNLNSSLANEVAFMHSMNATKCYTNDYPIIQCTQWESYPEWKAPFFRFVNQAERKKFFNRCAKYEFDKNRPKQLQLRDLAFNHHQISVNDIKNMSQNTFNLQKCEFIRSD